MANTSQFKGRNCVDSLAAHLPVPLLYQLGQVTTEFRQAASKLIVKPLPPLVLTSQQNGGCSLNLLHSHPDVFWECESVRVHDAPDDALTALGPWRRTVRPSCLVYQGPGAERVFLELMSYRMRSVVLLALPDGLKTGLKLKQVLDCLNYVTNLAFEVRMFADGHDWVEELGVWLSQRPERADNIIVDLTRAETNAFLDSKSIGQLLTPTRCAGVRQLRLHLGEESDDEARAAVRRRLRFQARDVLGEAFRQPQQLVQACRFERFGGDKGWLPEGELRVVPMSEDTFDE